MNTTIRELLKERNNRIISMIIEKIRLRKINSVNLIGISGSFLTNDYYEKSDLDLLIIGTDETAHQLASCFILDDVAHDIYITPWSRLEEMSLYKTPYISKLMHLDIVYTQNEHVLARYMQLRQDVTQRLNDSDNNYRTAHLYFKRALAASQMLDTSVPRGEFFMTVFSLLKNLEYSLYILNGAYIQRGVRRIPEELEHLRNISSGFTEHYQSLFMTDDLGEVKKSTELLLQMVTSLFLNPASGEITEEKQLAEKKPLNANDLTGVYEEIYSNWKNKMEHAVTLKSTYLSFMTMASCQDYYNELYNTYSDFPHIDIMERYNAHDLQQNVTAFNEGLAVIEKLYKRWNKMIKRYQTFEELHESYMKQ